MPTPRRTPALPAVAEAYKTVTATELHLKRIKGEWELAGSSELGPEWDALQMAQEHFEMARDNWLLEESRVRRRASGPLSGGPGGISG